MTEYIWNEENRLTESRINGKITRYLYNGGGERTAKMNEYTETIYVDKFFQVADIDRKETAVATKHIFVGETRVVSKLSHYWKNEIDIEYEKRNQYWYHPDHLGNTTYVTTVKEEYGLRYAQIFEHYEYMPYGETWIEERDKGARKIGYLFTSKELDEETGLYYFGARYLDPKTSRWMSPDPIYDGLKEGLSIYGYAGNNPIKYTDPNGLTYTYERGTAIPGTDIDYKDNEDADRNDIYGESKILSKFGNGGVVNGKAYRQLENGAFSPVILDDLVDYTQNQEYISMMMSNSEFHDVDIMEFGVGFAWGIASYFTLGLVDNYGDNKDFQFGKGFAEYLLVVSSIVSAGIKLKVALEGFESSGYNFSIKLDNNKLNISLKTGSKSVAKLAAKGGIDIYTLKYGLGTIEKGQAVFNILAETLKIQGISATKRVKILKKLIGGMGF